MEVLVDQYMEDNWREVCADRFEGDFSALARYADQVGASELREWALAEYAKGSAAPADPAADPVDPAAPVDPAVDPVTDTPADPAVDAGTDPVAEADATSGRKRR